MGPPVSLGRPNDRFPKHGSVTKSNTPGKSYAAGTSGIKMCVLIIATSVLGC